MKILVIGGMHGNEPLGIEVVKLLRSSNVTRVDTLLANEPAITANVRFTGADLNRSFPGGTGGYEAIRAREILEICKGYDLVVDFHNTHCPNNDCSFVGEMADDSLFAISSWLGLGRVIVADYDCLNKYAANCISVEISLSSPLMEAARWVRLLSDLSELDSLPSRKDIKKYRFAYRMSLEDRDRLRLDRAGLEAFKPLTKRIASELGVKSPAYPIFIDDAYTPYNFGGLVNEINV